VVRYANYVWLINYEVIRIRAKCILVHGVEVTVPQWVVRTSKAVRPREYGDIVRFKALLSR